MLQSAPLDCSLADLAVGGLASAADVLVAKGNRVLAHERAGCDEDSRFLLFSLSKVITAAAVLALVDTGAIYLHTRIAALVPEFAAGGKERVTVEDVLTHRGGFSETMSGAHLDLADFADPERMRAAICALPCLPELYGVAVYHPLSYSILGAVVEEASGLSFELWCQQTIFRPLGMAETTWGLPSELRSAGPPDRSAPGIGIVTGCTRESCRLATPGAPPTTFPVSFSCCGVEASSMIAGSSRRPRWRRWLRPTQTRAAKRSAGVRVRGDDRLGSGPALRPRRNRLASLLGTPWLHRDPGMVRPWTRISSSSR